MIKHNTRETIVIESIKSLQAEGLRFSVDTLAKRLKISKKTIYKYFSTKEELAAALYDTFYKNCYLEISRFDKLDKRNYTLDVLRLYYNSYCMVCDAIFNKYALNEAIKQDAQTKHNELWKKIVLLLEIKEERIYKTIIDGAFAEISRTGVKSEEIINKIGDTLC